MPTLSTSTWRRALWVCYLNILSPVISFSFSFQLTIEINFNLSHGIQKIHLVNIYCGQSNQIKIVKALEKLLFLFNTSKIMFVVVSFKAFYTFFLYLLATTNKYTCSYSSNVRLVPTQNWTFSFWFIFSFSFFFFTHYFSFFFSSSFFL